MYQNVLLLDGIGPQARPILESAGFNVFEAKGLGKNPEDIRLCFEHTYKGVTINAVCLRSGTELKGASLAVLRRAGVELIVRFGAGTDNIDSLSACQNGILVQNTPGQNSTSVAEKTILYAMALCHNVGLAIANQNIINVLKKMQRDIGQHVKDQAAQSQFNTQLELLLNQVELKKSAYSGTELYGKTIGVIGYGGFIGNKVCTRAMNLGMTVLGYDPFANHEIEGVRLSSLDEIFALSDFITVHIPLTEKTKNLIGGQQIAQCRRQPKLLNLARAGIIDVVAVFTDMSGDDPKISGYASDVDDPSAPVFNLPQAFCTPHIGAATQESEARCAVMGAKQVCAWLTQGIHQHGVNFPDIGISDNDNLLTVFHLDQPGMINQISGYFSGKGNNIDTFHTVPGKSGFACTLIGLKSAIGPEAILELENLTGVIRVISRQS